MAHGERRDRVIAKMKEMGYRTTGFRDAVRVYFQKFHDEEWEGYIQTADYEGEEKEAPEEPPVWPKPTAWREYGNKDDTGRDWVVFEAVEPMFSRMSDRKVRQYLDFWFYLDSHDELIGLDLVLMDETGRKHPLDLHSLFFQGASTQHVEQMGAVPPSVYRKREES